MSKLILASWETLPQVSIIWTGDINSDGLVLALIVALWLLRSEHNGRFPMRKRMDRGTLSYWGFYASKGGRTRSGRWSR